MVRAKVLASRVPYDGPYTGRIVGGWFRISTTPMRNQARTLPSVPPSWPTWAPHVLTESQRGVSTSLGPRPLYSMSVFMMSNPVMCFLSISALCRATAAVGSLWSYSEDKVSVHCRQTTRRPRKLPLECPLRGLEVMK